METLTFEGKRAKPQEVLVATCDDDNDGDGDDDDDDNDDTEQNQGTLSILIPIIGLEKLNVIGGGKTHENLA